MTQQHQSTARRRRRKTSLWTSSSSLTLVWLFVSLLLFRGIVAAATSLSSLLSLSIGVNSLSILMMGIHATAAEVFEKRADENDRRDSTASTTTSVLGAPAPAITLTSDTTRPYGVENDTFTDYTSARQRSCNDQFNVCQLMANDDETVDFTVSDCQGQQTTCLDTKEAVQVSSSASSSEEPKTTETTMVTVTMTTTSVALAPTTSSLISSSSTTTTVSSSSTTIATTAAPLVTTTATTSQSSATQKTTITQGQYILICDV